MKFKFRLYVNEKARKKHSFAAHEQDSAAKGAVILLLSWQVLCKGTCIERTDKSIPRTYPFNASTGLTVIFYFLSGISIQPRRLSSFIRRGRIWGILLGLCFHDDRRVKHFTFVKVITTVIPGVHVTPLPPRWWTWTNVFSLTSFVVAEHDHNANFL